MDDSPETREVNPSPTPEQLQSGFFSAVRESIRGSQQDFTKGPIGRSVLILSVPMVLEMLMESIFVVCDVYFVGRLGSDAVATVGLTESLLTIVYTIGIGLSIGVTAMVARRIGEHNPDGAARVAVQAIILGLIISAIIGVTGVIFASSLLKLMGASDAVVNIGLGFTRMMLAGNASILMLFLLNAVFRGAGDAAISMRVLWLANLINIILGPCLIFGVGPFPELGVVGAAVGTTIGRSVGALYAFSRLVRFGDRVQIKRIHLIPDLALMWRLIRMSSAAAFQVFIGMASWIGLIRIISKFGSDALAGYTIGMRVILFALLPSWGMSNAAATMVGQALGAGKPDRAERAVWKAGFYNMLFLGVVGLVFIVFAGNIIRIFTVDENAIPYGIDCLRIVACGFLFYAYGMVVTQSFNGAGDTFTPTIINLFVFWLWEIPLAYVLAFTFKLGPRGVFFAMMIAFSSLAVVSALIFRRGHWKTKVV